MFLWNHRDIPGFYTENRGEHYDTDSCERLSYRRELQVDGGNNRNEALLDFMERMKGKAEFHPVCPEQLGGLSTPRPASEVRENDGVVVNTRTGM